MFLFGKKLEHKMDFDTMSNTLYKLYKSGHLFPHVRWISGDGEDVPSYSRAGRGLYRDIYNGGLLSKQHRHFEKTLTRTYSLV